MTSAAASPHCRVHRAPVEANGVAAILAEAKQPGRGTRAARSAVREITHHRVHRAPGMNRFPQSGAIDAMMSEVYAVVSTRYLSPVEEPRT